MLTSYYNHHAVVARNAWARRAFLRNWWRLYDRDPHWVPPYYPALRRAVAGHHLAHRRPVPLHVEALLRRHGRPTAGVRAEALIPTDAMPRPVAAAVALASPTRPGAATVALLHCENDLDTLTHLLEQAAEASGRRHLIGPTHLVPHLGSGTLASHWNLLPPLHTPYAPPYLDELLGRVMRPTSTSHLYHLPIPTHQPTNQPSNQQTNQPSNHPTLTPLDPARLTTDLFPLLAAACAPWQPPFPPPTTEDAAFLLWWLGHWPLFGWLAQVAGEPVGFVLLQPDMAPRLRRANGGRRLWWRGWLRAISSRPGRDGRLLFGAVLPEWRGRGIGARLLAAAQATGRKRGWRTLSVGPVPEGAPAGEFLTAHGAERRQRYRLFSWEAPPVWF